MSTTNYPQALPLFGPDGKPILPVTLAEYVINGVTKNDPQFVGSIYLNGIKVFSTTTGEGGEVVNNPLDPSMGGTGFDNLNDLANKIAEILGLTTGGSGSEPGSLIIPIEKGGTGSTTAADALTALGAASVALYQASIPVSWTSAETGYTQTVSVTGMLGTDVPVVGVVLSSDAASAQLQGKAFACVNRITTANGSITLYAYNTAPTQAFTIQLLTVRGFQ